MMFINAVNPEARRHELYRQFTEAELCGSRAHTVPGTNFIKPVFIFDFAWNHPQETRRSPPGGSVSLV